MQTQREPRTVSVSVEHADPVTRDMEFSRLLEKPHVTRPRDIYDEGVEYLAANPDKIYDAWNSAAAGIESAGCLTYPLPRGAYALFAHVTQSRNPRSKIMVEYCGCLTQVKAGTDPAETMELTDIIRADKRIPRKTGKFKRKTLEHFAEMQRWIDKELGREPL